MTRARDIADSGAIIDHLDDVSSDVGAEVSDHIDEEFIYENVK